MWDKQGFDPNYMNGKTALGKITSVNVPLRTCSVKTLGLPGVTDDLTVDNVRILHIGAHYEGDESAWIPRIGAYGVLIWVNNEPMIIGYFRIMPGGGVAPSDQDDLSPGDFIHRMANGNKVIVRAGGTVQVESTVGCRTFYIPNQDIINAVCKNLEFRAGGGLVNWTLDRNSLDTVLKFVAWNNLNPTIVMNLTIGATGAPPWGQGTEDSEIDPEAPFLDLAIGPPTADMKIEKKNIALQIKPSGETKLDIGPGKMTLVILPDGTVTLTAAGAISITTEKDFSLTATGNVAIKATDVSVDASGNAAVKAGGDASIEAGGKVAVKAGGDASIQAGGNANIDGAKIVLNKGVGAILTTKTMPVVDNITGAPSVGIETVLA
jgi:hypothetical protein